MSSLLEIPVQLALILQLAAADPAAMRQMSGGGGTVQAATTREIVYTDERWLDVLERHGADIGEGPLAARIFRTRSGLVYVPVPAERASLLGRRQDAAIVHSVTRQAAAANADWVSTLTGRQATPAELYLAHIARRSEARALINAEGRDLVRPAAELAPETAAAHRRLFFAGTRALTVAEVQRHVELALQRAELASLQAPANPSARRDTAWRTVTVRWDDSGERLAKR